MKMRNESSLKSRYMMLIVVYITICLTNTVGNAEVLQEGRIQNEEYYREERATKLLEPLGWTIQYTEVTQDLVLPDSLTPSIDEEETIFWAIVNECSKIVDLDITPFLGKAVHATRYRAETYRNASKHSVIIIEHEDEIIGAYTLSFERPESLAGVLASEQNEEILKNTVPSSHIPEVNQSSPLDVATTYLNAKVNEDAATALALTDITFIYNNLIWYHDDMLIMGTPLRIAYQSSDIKQVISYDNEICNPSNPENERFYEYTVEYFIDDGDGLVRTLVVSLVEEKGIWKVYQLSEFF